MLRGDPLCHAIFANETCCCESPDDQCDYEVEYADNGSSLGVLVTDYFHLRLMNGSLVRPHIAFGSVQYYFLVEFDFDGSFIHILAWFE